MKAYFKFVQPFGASFWSFNSGLSFWLTDKRCVMRCHGGTITILGFGILLEWRNF